MIKLKNILRVYYWQTNVRDHSIDLLPRIKLNQPLNQFVFFPPTNFSA
jgi:hypothetical protein